MCSIHNCCKTFPVWDYWLQGVVYSENFWRILFFPVWSCNSRCFFPKLCWNKKCLHIASCFSVESILMLNWSCKLMCCVSVSSWFLFRNKTVDYNVSGTAELCRILLVWSNKEGEVGRPHSIHGRVKCIHLVRKPEGKIISEWMLGKRWEDVDRMFLAKDRGQWTR